MVETIGILDNFECIDFQDVKEGFLLKRRDKKYLVHQASLPSIVEELLPSYKLMTVNEMEYNEYHTSYYDTPDFEFYMKHHNGIKNRYKLRNRTYLSTNVTFNELKHKNNKSVTLKTRRLVEVGDREVSFKSLLPDHLSKEVLKFEPKLKIDYRRLTFVNQTNRITIDQDLKFYNDSNSIKLGNVAIVEFKYKNASEWRVFNRLMLDQKVRPISVSKYCVGVCYLYNLKKNNFKKVLREIDKIELI